MIIFSLEGRKVSPIYCLKFVYTKVLRRCLFTHAAVTPGLKESS